MQQALLQLLAAPPGILSRLARAFQGNSFTPCLQTICYCSRRSWWVAGRPAGTTIGGWHWSQPGRRHNINQLEGSGGATGPRVVGRDGWVGTNRTLQPVGRVHWVGFSWRGNARLVGGSHQKHPFLTYSKSQGHTGAGSWQNVDLQMSNFCRFSNLSDMAHF